MSASSNTITGALPPSSRCTRFSVSAAVRAMTLPVATSPVSDTIATSGWRDERVAGGLALAGHDVEHAGREDVGGDLGEPQRAERRELRRLQHDGVARGERGAELPRRHVERVVPRRDRPDDAERVAAEERRVVLEVLARGAALEEAGAAGEEAPVVDGEVHLELDDRARACRRCCISSRLMVVEVGLDRVGDLVQDLAARSRGVVAAHVVERRRPRPRPRRRRRRASLAGTLASTSPVAGFRTSSVAPLRAARHVPPMKFSVGPSTAPLVVPRRAGRQCHDVALPDRVSAQGIPLRNMCRSRNDFLAHGSAIARASVPHRGPALRPRRDADVAR